MPTYRFPQLEQIATSLLEAAGVPSDTASIVAKSLVLNERFGHSSHGLLRIPYYVQLIQKRRLDPYASIEIVRETPSTALIDGRWGFGQIIARQAMHCAVDKARKCGIAAVGVYHLNHVGRLGEYTEMAAAEEFVAFVFNGGAPEDAIPNVAPFGGAKAVWGTNPIAVAIPTGESSFSLDFATSIIAGGKAAVARSKGMELPEGCVMDAEGRPTQDPWAVIQGGAILPFGEHKGYGLGFVVELLAGALIGAAAPELAEGEMATGALFLVFDPGHFRPITPFQTSVAKLFQRVKECPPAEGFQEVLIPGEPEQRSQLASDKTGIFVPDSVCEELAQVGRKLGITLEWEA
jgi:LDH2 family malate/lactate/ureidoglycolate dehydrogenase